MRGAVRSTGESLRAREAAAAVLGVPVHETRAAPLGVRPGRQVFAVEARGRRVVAKCYPDDARARQGAERLAALGGDHGPLRVPRCLRVDPDASVVVMSALSGRPLPQVLDGPTGSDAVARLGRAVAALHAIQVELPAVLDRVDVIGRAAWSTFERQDLTRAAVALDRAVALLESSAPAPRVPSHGDLGPAQVLVDEDGIGIVDFDKAAMAEPALDLGNLLAQLARRRGDEGIQLFERLLDAYRQAVLDPPGTVPSSGGTRTGPVADGPPPAAAEDPGQAGSASGSVVRAYALLILVRKLSWLPSPERAPVRDAIDALARDA